MSLKKFATEYLSFTRRDRIGLLTIFLLILLVHFLPGLIPHSSNVPVNSDTSWIAELKSLEQHGPGTNTGEFDDDENYTRTNTKRGNYVSDKIEGELFYFDPNTLPTVDWKRLGLRDKTIRIIRNYLQKGGRFRTPEDLRRIYGLGEDTYARLLPYIRIENPGFDKTTGYPADEYRPVKKETRIYTIADINSADTSDFINLPGIGNKLALRIVLFRDRLGGFYSVEQVGETFGLPDSVFQKIKSYLQLGNTGLKKIDINSITLDELKTHPYLKYGIANPIVAYRNEHGPFQKIEDIKKVMAVTDDVYRKIAPYLSIKD